MPVVHAPSRAAFAALVLAPVLAACGGGGGGDRPASLVEVLFPPGVSLTEGALIHVRGRSAGASLTSVTVGGVPATSADGFQTWSAAVPLALGRNDLDVVAADATGQPDPAPPTLQVQRGVLMATPASMDLDVGGDRLLLLDAGVKRLTLYDLGTQTLTVLSGPGRGSGTAFGKPEAGIFDLPRGRALVADSQLDAVFAVDLATGNRTFLTGQGAGSGVALTGPDGMALDAAGNRVLVVDNGLDAIVAVSLTNGARTVLSSAAVGTGTAFSLPTDIAYDGTVNRAYVRDPSIGALFSIALATGNRSIVVQDAGNYFAQSGGMALDLPNNRMLATDGGFDRVFATDLTTGAHTTVSNGTGSGPALRGPSTLVHDPARGRVIVGHFGYQRLLAVNLSNGNRSALYDLQLGSGTRFDDPQAVAFDLPRRRLLVADEGLGALLAVRYASGDRSVFLAGSQPAGDFERPQLVRMDEAGGRALVYGINPTQVVSVRLDDGAMDVIARMPDVGSGESLQFASDMAYDAVASRVLLTISNPVNGLLQVDELTGDRSVFSNAAVGTGEPTSGAIVVEADPGGAVVYYGTNVAGTIGRIDVATGVRTKLTADNIASGPALGGMAALRLDGARSRLVVPSWTADAVLAVDLSTGNRSVLAGAGIGEGVPIASIGGSDVDVENQLAALYDPAMRVFVVADLTSGDRVAFAR